jgi:hypothetical protein
MPIHNLCLVYIGGGGVLCVNTRVNLRRRAGRRFTKAKASDLCLACSDRQG